MNDDKFVIKFLDGSYLCGLFGGDEVCSTDDVLNACVFKTRKLAEKELSKAMHGPCAKSCIGAEIIAAETAMITVQISCDVSVTRAKYVLAEVRKAFPMAEVSVGRTGGTSGTLASGRDITTEVKNVVSYALKSSARR